MLIHRYNPSLEKTVNSLVPHSDGHNCLATPNPRWTQPHGLYAHAQVGGHSEKKTQTMVLAGLISSVWSEALVGLSALPDNSVFHLL